MQQNEKPISTGFPSADELLGGGLRRGELSCLADSVRTDSTELLCDIAAAFTEQTDENVLLVCVSGTEEEGAGRRYHLSHTLIAARPAMGKTSFALQLAGNIAAVGESVCFCSLEMSKDGLIRILEKQSGSIHGYKTLHIDDHTNADVPYITGKIHSLAKCDAVFVDYLQLMARRPTPKAMTEIMSALKDLACNENIPVILTCQILKRDPFPNCFDEDQVFRPKLSDFLRSGALTQDPDVIIFPFRESYYVEESELHDKDELKHELIVAKNRFGATGAIPVHWNPEKMIFEEQSEFFDIFVFHLAPPRLL